MSDNSNIKTLNGTDLILMIEGDVSGEFQPVAHATAHSIELTRATRGISSKSTGDWDLQEYGKLSWSGSLDALMAVKDSNDIISYDQLLDLQIARTTIKIISITNTPVGIGALDENPLDAEVDTYDPQGAAAATDNVFVVGSKYYEGEVIITSMSKTASDGETATYSMSFTGSSALVPKTVTIGS